MVKSIEIYKGVWENVRKRRLGWIYYFLALDLPLRSCIASKTLLDDEAVLLLLLLLLLGRWCEDDAEDENEVSSMVEHPGDDDEAY